MKLWKKIRRVERESVEKPKLWRRVRKLQRELGWCRLELSNERERGDTWLEQAQRLEAEVAKMKGRRLVPPPAPTHDFDHPLVVWVIARAMETAGITELELADPTGDEAKRYRLEVDRDIFKGKHVLSLARKCPDCDRWHSDNRSSFCDNCRESAKTNAQ